MKRLITAIFLISILVACGTDYEAYKNVENTPADYPIIPKSADLQIQKETFSVDENTFVHAPQEL